MRPRHLVIPAAIALLGLTACSTAAPAPGDGGGTSSEGGTLSFLSPWTQAQTQPMIDAYAEEAPDVTLNVTYVAGNENAQQLLTTQLAAGNGPDVFYLNPGAGSTTSVGQLAEAGYLLDLSDRDWADGVEEPYRSFLSYDDALYAYPSTIFGIGAIYNEDKLDEAGLEAPTTYSDLLDFCADAREAGSPAFTLGAGAAWINALIPYAFASTLVDSREPDFEAEVGSGSDFTSSEWVTAMDQYQEMIDAGCFQDNPTGTDGPTTWVSAGTGQTFAVVAPGALLSEIERNAAGSATFRMQALPATDDADDTTIPVSLSSTLGVNADSPNQELALDFVDWLSQPTQLAQISELQAGAVPTIPTDEFEVPASISVVTEYQEEDRTTPVPDLAWPNPEIQAALQSGGQALVLGQQSPGDVLEAMQAAAS